MEEVGKCYVILGYCQGIIRICKCHYSILKINCKNLLYKNLVKYMFLYCGVQMYEEIDEESTVFPKKIEKST
jgi:hypothetical protein